MFDYISITYILGTKSISIYGNLNIGTIGTPSVFIFFKGVNHV